MHPASIHHQEEGGEGNGFLIRVVGETPPELPHLPLYNRYEGLESENQGHDVHECPSGLEELSRLK